MRDRTSKPLVGELADLTGAGRDLRIDACRGIALEYGQERCTIAQCRRSKSG
jgi:hypothetical protein